jgi:hypothetical protein
MYPVLRAALFAPVSLILACTLYAQPAELPPIFVPRSETSPAQTRAKVSRPATTSPVSNRARTLINAASSRVLEQAVVFDGPSPAGGTFVDATTGATVMAPVIVRGESLTESQVRPPELRLYHFVPFGGDNVRRVAGGATATLFQFAPGKTLELNVLNLAGNGIDHNIDFSRVEIAFRFKW